MTSAESITLRSAAAVRFGAVSRALGAGRGFGVPTRCYEVNFGKAPDPRQISYSRGAALRPFGIRARTTRSSANGAERGESHAQQ
jgi:hypothetical protein